MTTTKPTQEIQDKIVAALRAGNYEETAARYAGISESTLREWMELGAAPKAAAAYKQFRDAVEKATASAEVRDIALIDKAAQEGSWQAAAWKLDRKFAYGTTSEDSGARVGPNQQALLATFDNLGVDPKKSVRAQMCITLANQLDANRDPSVNVASIAKELRLAVGELEKSVNDFDNELGAFLADLSSPIRHTEEP
jgi:hypothetical protein